MNLFNLKTKSKKLFQASFIFAIFAVLFNNCSQQGDIRLQADPSASTIAPESPTTITPIATEPNDSLGTPNDGSNNDNSGGTSTPENTVKYKTITEQLSVNLTLNNKVDILIVIDNSGSMSYEQSEMAKRFSGFVESLNGLDWQLGITTTDVTTNKFFSDGRLLQFDNSGTYKITSSDDPTLAAQLFANTIQRPSNEGSGSEQGVRATYRAIQRSELAITDDSTKNKELFRDGANLAVIIISDANESPFNTGAVYENDPANLLKYLTAKWPNKITTFSSIVVKTNDTTCLYDKTSSNESYGKAYEFLSNTTDGIIGSVCEKDYSSQLKIIGQSIKDKISSFKLSCNPVDADKSGLVDFSITDSQNLSLSNYSISKNIVSFSNDLAVGIYKLVYTCIDE